MRNTQQFPPALRHGSELDAPLEPVAQTTKGNQSVFLAELLGGSVILRVSPSGYRCVIRSMKDTARYYVAENGLNSGSDLSLIGDVARHLEGLLADPTGPYLDCTTEELQESLESLKAFPNMALIAWNVVARNQWSGSASPEWVPASVEQARKRGVIRGY